MVTRSTHLALIWLVAAGLLVQSLWAGVPLGASLCIGCDEGGWSVASATPTPASSCCSERETPETARVASAEFTASPCGCIRIPMSLSLTLHTSREVAGVPTIATPALLAILPAPSLDDAALARVRPDAGPPEPPRLLAPMSRRTVLLL